LALFGIMMAQGVVWYTGFFYSQFYLERILKIDSRTVNFVMMSVVLISAPGYWLFAALSDRVGRKPVMLFGMLLMLVLYFPGYQFLTRVGNPALANATAASPVVVVADPADCSFQLDLTGGARLFATSCDIAKGVLASAGVSYTTEAAAPGALAQVRVGDVAVESVDATGRSMAEIRAARTDVEARVRTALNEAGYPSAADPNQTNLPAVIGILLVMALAATALYGPQAAALVELFPTRIRYTAMSFPYHVGTGWFGGLLPAIVFAINTTTGTIYSGLWFPVICTAIAAAVCFFFVPETKNRDIHA
jgi:MFS family permease